MIDTGAALAIANVIFTIGSIAFTLALVPTLLNKQSAIPASSSALTAGFLWAYVWVYSLLGTEEAMVAGAATALMWTLILIFRRPKVG